MIRLIFTPLVSNFNFDQCSINMSNIIRYRVSYIFMASIIRDVSSYPIFSNIFVNLIRKNKATVICICLSLKLLKMIIRLFLTSIKKKPK